MKRLLCALLLVLPASAFPCGIERWPVKTLQDPLGETSAASLPVAARIIELVTLAPPSHPALNIADAKRFPEERRAYQVKALLIGFKHEADDDFHIVIAEPDKPSVTMIAEIPSGECAAQVRRTFFVELQAQFVLRFGKPTAKFKRLRQPIPITITGIGFFDFPHGQTGAAPNGIELHPVIAWEVAPAAGLLVRGEPTPSNVSLGR
jgi:hypothetical protein